MCILNQICGVSHVIETSAQNIPTNIISVDYTDIEDSRPDIEDVLQVSQPARDKIEQTTCRYLAQEILNRLPQNEVQAQALLDTGFHLAQQMNWDTVIENTLCPLLKNTLATVN